MKKIKLLIVFIIGLILSSCSNQNPEELNEFIVSPKLASPILEGTWQVTKVEEITNKSNSQSPEVGDRLYITDNLVAINNEYAFPPTFTSKYVNLSEYLVNRGFENITADSEEMVVVINASQGQFFARDFVKRSDDEIFYIADDKLVYLSKLSDIVDGEIIQTYTALANNERIRPAVSETASEDISLLLGVRERTDRPSGKPDYNYYTYLIRIPEDEEVKYKKAPDVFLRGKDEYWKVRCVKNSLEDIYDSIEAFPARYENQMDDPAVYERYSFRDFDMNMKLNFVDRDYISFSYTRSLFNDNAITKYGFLATNGLEENRLLTIDEFTGENDATEQFENMILNEASNKVSDVNPSEIDLDNTNFGMVRDAGMWVIQTSLYTKDSQVMAASQLPVRNYVEERNENKTSITRDQVRNINPQFKDFHILNNGNYIVIQSQDEIMIHRVIDNLIEKRPFFSIATQNPTAIISLDQQSGSNAKTLEEAFTNTNTIIDGN